MIMMINRKLIAAAILLSAGVVYAEDARIEGQTEPVAKVEVPSVMRGVLAEMNVKEGQAIKKGDVIARLDSQLQEANVEIQTEKANSATEIDYAKKALEFSVNEYEKYRNNPAANVAEREGKRLEKERSEAYLKKTEETRRLEALTLKREQLILSRMTIKSPIDGFVFRLPKQAGEAIDENQPAAVIVQTSKVRVNFFLPEIFFKDPRVKEGQKVTIELATTPVMKREAVIVTVDPFVDPAGHLFRVKMEMDNADYEVPVGIAAVWKLAK